MPDVDVVVVGAGLAGLVCARELGAAGRSVQVLEAGDAPGGRVRTDVVDGFRLDRGFQVLLTGYPEFARQVDLEALDLQRFSPGVTVRLGGRFHRLADPTREPWSAPGALGVASPLDGIRLLRWRQHLLRTRGDTLATGTQTTTARLLAEQGFSDRLVRGFFAPFVAGTFFDRELTTSTRLTELVFRTFFRGDVAVPADGMGALPAQIADRLPDGVLRLGARVQRVESGRVLVEGGEHVDASTVVVATQAPAAADLLPDADVNVAARGATTIHYDAASSPVGGPHLVLGGDADGPVTTAVCMSDVAPAYAPAGRALVSAATVGVAPGDDDRADEEVRAQLRGWWGEQVDGWRRLRVDRIPYAQPRMDPVDLPSLRRPVRVRHGLYVCGDHRDTASLQGAMVSGRRTAEAVIAAG